MKCLKWCGDRKEYGVWEFVVDCWKVIPRAWKDRDDVGRSRFLPRGRGFMYLACLRWKNIVLRFFGDES
jgi:hypothetical protein